MNYHWYMFKHRIPYGIRKAWSIVTGQVERPPAPAALLRLAYRVDLVDELVIDKLMAGGQLPPRYRYRHFLIPKKGGGWREIAEPGSELKRIQRRILATYLEDGVPHPATVGFRQGMSIADHAWAHAGASLIITADIADFFPSTTQDRVHLFWQEQGFDDAQALLFTRLTAYKGALPQGAPTSPALSNLLNVGMDAAITRRIRRDGGHYTRYCDDMVFSWPDGYRPAGDLEAAIRSILLEYGYRLNAQKGWRVWQRRDEPEVTGLVLTRRGEVDIPQSMKEIIRALERSSNIYEQWRLAGYRGYVEMVRTKRKRQAVAAVPFEPDDDEFDSLEDFEDQEDDDD